MDEFNFDELTRVSRKVVRGEDIIPPISRSTKAGRVTFRFSRQAIDDLGLDVNSLKSYVSKDKKSVFLAVCPGNKGDFMKARGSSDAEKQSKKGNSASNNDLSSALDAAGYEKALGFSITRVGQSGDEVYWKMEPMETSSVASAEKKAPKKAKPEATASASV